MRAVRQTLSVERVVARSERICERLLAHPGIVSAKGVALFWPMIERREVDLRSFDDALRQRGVRLCYPFMEREADGGLVTGFRWVSERSQLVEQGHRFAEPPQEAPLALRGEVDVVVVSALAVASDGYRLGYGAGFYDATLPDLCPPARSIVVAFDFQYVMELPTDEHDLRCDDVITDA
jgi:5-formyltetrahydrofolate cyclo-ligase